MSGHDYLQTLVFLCALLLLTPIVGAYLVRFLWTDMNRQGRAGRLAEWFVLRIVGVGAAGEMTWQQYTLSLVWFNLFGLALLFVIQLFQAHLPLNPTRVPNVAWPLAFNTAVSFVTNTNWQSYAGETTMSHLTQMLGLAVQNFVSAATGMAVFLALVRGLVRRSATTIGNFWSDLVRCTFFVLMPLCLVFAIFLVSQGVPQSFDGSVQASTLEGAHQTIPLGPVASQIAIKQLGTNGGGFFNANSAHPFENPTPLSNFFEMLAILLIPAATVHAYGRMTRARRHAAVVFGVMFFLLIAGLTVSLWSETSTHASLAGTPWLEGKETRFGVVGSVLWSVSTTAASNGSVNAMHSSLTPLSGLVALFNMMIGEVVFGGVGAGMYGMLMFILLTVFLAGLMVGRTPEFLGKRIEAAEIRWVLVAVLAPSAAILAGAAVACVTPAGLSGPTNPGPHGLSEILYAFASAAGNNGSAFASLNANTVFYNLALGIAMLIGRYAVIVPALAIAGSLVRKKPTPASSGTFPTDTMTFGVMLAGIVVIVGFLTFLPALTLGPIVEHFLMALGRTF